jgi:hypothetical protein
MTTQTATKFWSNIDDNRAESLSGGYSYQFLFGTFLLKIESATLIPGLASALVPSTAAPGLAATTTAPVASAPAAPVNGFTITYSPNPIPGGPLVETRTPIFQNPTSIQSLT